MPAVFNAANEEAANAFLRGDLEFLAITDAVEASMSHHKPLSASLENILQADQWARAQVRERFPSRAGAS